MTIRHGPIGGFKKAAHPACAVPQWSRFFRFDIHMLHNVATSGAGVSPYRQSCVQSCWSSYLVNHKPKLYKPLNMAQAQVFKWQWDNSSFFRVPTFPQWQNPMIFPISRKFFKFPGVIFLSSNDCLTSLATALQVGSFETYRTLVKLWWDKPSPNYHALVKV